MNRFDLNSLPKCGAKTRSGNSCKRFGNKTNGRCKLHGGKSTGAKSKDGKLVVSKNAVTNFGNWIYKRNIKIETMNRVDHVINELITLAKSNLESREVDDKLVQLFNEYRIDVESLKYGIVNKFGINTFLIVQSALDRYYKVINNNHMKFHVLLPTVEAPYFYRGETAPQESFSSDLLTKSLNQWLEEDPYE